ncbi:hypothetical protein BDV23DRAFT_150266 [Aspergillus alliaceus]|uniref:Uncharacterized protein n=1 Tax=Petromyces alliaceus TaxID=209559 RepID=A0A5N7CGI1_PETAA|nr:hypothetical protein BDV23DRAFT_150266 [Aspergillus alliaceus]
MSHGRVIQDSDDEDDPLTADFLPPANPAHQTDNNYAPNPDAQDVDIIAPVREPNHPITINFDEFLQSQEAASRGLSSSQQQREERWIPGETAGGGSIGSMMTEIGRAQRRLFDDDADQHLPPTAGFESDSLQPTVSHTDDVHLIPAVEIKGPHETGYINNEGGPGYMYQTNDTVTYQYEPIAHAAQQNHRHGHSLISNDFSQSAASYNLFESSLHPSTGSSLDPISFLRPNDALQMDLQNGPRRWNSMQGMPSSPHDTEPNSSLLSPKVSRSRSDNTGSNGVSHVEVHQPIASPNEPFHPITIEIPTEPKKRGRPKKQTAPEVAEDPEPAGPAIQETSEINHPKPEKRKPGRPPKNAKQDNDIQTINNQPELLSPASNEPTLPNPPTDTSQTNKPENTILRLKLPTAPQTHQQPLSHTETTLSTEPPKEPKKKKLKRGKTTSITLTKTYDPDIEDDVIWIDQPPSNPPIPNPHHQHALDTDNNPRPTIPVPGNDTQPVQDPAFQSEAQAHAPKKRGRKRKKTSDAVVEEPLETINATNPSDIKLDQNNIPQEETIADTVGTTHSMVDENTPNPEADTSTLIQKEALATNDNPPETPRKSGLEPGPGGLSTETSAKASKGLGKHSPISTGKVPYRVGLSRKARIAPLLKIVKR